MQSKQVSREIKEAFYKYSHSRKISVSKVCPSGYSFVPFRFVPNFKWMMNHLPVYSIFSFLYEGL
jgi:hypothetical protein